MIDWNKLSKSIIGANGDQGKITQILSDFETEVTTFNTKLTNLEKQTKDQEGEITSLQKTNMNLFLKIGQPVPQETINSTKEMTYEDLLNNWDKKGE